MILVVAGPTYAIFIIPVTNMVAKGAKTLHRFASANVPPMPFVAVPNAVRTPGYVRARTTGRPACMVKYMGKIFCWREENWGRGRVRKATMPPIKDWQRN